MEVKKRVKELIEIFETSGLSEMEFDADGLKLKLKKACADTSSDMCEAVPSRPNAVSKAVKTEPKTEEDESSKEYIKSPLVGTLYLAPNPESKPFVKVGSKVKKGETMCIIEAMKMMNELKAPYNLVVKNILQNDGDMVEFDQNIYEVERC